MTFCQLDNVVNIENTCQSLPDADEIRYCKSQRRFIISSHNEIRKWKILIWKFNQNYEKMMLWRMLKKFW